MWAGVSGLITTTEWRQLPLVVLTGRERGGRGAVPGGDLRAEIEGGREEERNLFYFIELLAICTESESGVYSLLSALSVHQQQARAEPTVCPSYLVGSNSLA